MPVYYFDISNHGHIIEDDQGKDLPGVEAARNEALLSARAQMAEAMRQGLDVGYREFRVRDQDDEVVFILPYREAILSE